MLQFVYTYGDMVESELLSAARANCKEGMHLFCVSTRPSIK